MSTQSNEEQLSSTPCALVVNVPMCLRDHQRRWGALYKLPWYAREEKEAVQGTPIIAAIQGRGGALGPIKAAFGRRGMLDVECWVYHLLYFENAHQCKSSVPWGFNTRQINSQFTDLLPTEPTSSWLANSGCCFERCRAWVRSATGEPLDSPGRSCH